MNPQTARQIVVASVASTVVIVIVSEAAAGHRPDMRTLVGLSFAFLFLSVMADFAPAVAGPLAVVVLLTSLVVPAPGMTESAGAIFLRSLQGTKNPHG